MGPAEALDDLVARGEDPGGAVAVVRGGVLEVDHAAGTAHADGSPYTVDTLVMTYSVAKPVAAIGALAAVADGHLALDTRVAEVWPEYAAEGKEATTLRHVLAHRAGVPTFPPAAETLPFDDREALLGLLARSTPVHPPGAGLAEHALTYGHLLDEVVRRAGGLPLAERVAALAGEAGWDLHLVVPDAALPRVADLVAIDPATWPSRYLEDPRWGPALGRPAGLLDPAVLNTSRWRRTSFPAIGLHASARALAALLDDVVRPDGRVATALGHDLWRTVVTPGATGHDLVLGREVTWTLGFQVDEEVLPDGRVHRELGMGGSGGCVAWSAPEEGYGAAYVSRGLGGHDRSGRIWDAVLESCAGRRG